MYERWARSWTSVPLKVSPLRLMIGLPHSCDDSPMCFNMVGDCCADGRLRGSHGVKFISHHMQGCWNATNRRIPCCSLMPCVMCVHADCKVKQPLTQETDLEKNYILRLLLLTSKETINGGRAIREKPLIILIQTAAKFSIKIQ
jgi:hypothetical protein